MLALSGLSEAIEKETVQHVVDLSLQLVAAGAAVYAAWKRKRSKIQPLTMTKSGAEQHPSTIANEQKTL